MVLILFSTSEMPECVSKQGTCDDIPRRGDVIKWRYGNWLDEGKYRVDEVLWEYHPGLTKVRVSMSLVSTS